MAAGERISFLNKSGRTWQITTFVLLLVSLGLLIALIVVASEKDDDKSTTMRVVDDSHSGSVCGEQRLNPNGNTIDLSEPDNPSPFRDLTRYELMKLREFLEKDPAIKANPFDQNFGIGVSYIFLADLWVAPKADVLRYLDNNGAQPPRQARVMMFRGDKSPPVVEEWICGPLPDVTKCDMMDFPNRRNPVEFASRPFNGIEFYSINTGILTKLDAELHNLFVESYNATTVGCPASDTTNCLTINPVPMASSLTGQIDKRRLWVWLLYDVPFPLLHPTDFGVLVALDGTEPALWTIEKVWYSGQVYTSLNDLATKYSARTIPLSRMTKPVLTNDLYSTLTRRGDPMPPNPQRPPIIVEPDGKRYSIKDRKVEYMGWTFHFRMSPYSGPVLYDIRFKDERIAYELALAEIAAYYSGNSPLSESTDYVDSGAVSGLGSKALVPGGDCPDSATLINYYLMNQHGPMPGTYDAVFCLFEHNNAYPLRRHLQSSGRTYYGGMLDSVLTLRSAHTVGNYDYIIDFIFHQNAALEIRLMSTGYIQSNVYRTVERLYGWKIEENILGNLHHHMFHIKADLDIGGVSNRYETLDIVPQKTVLTWDNTVEYHQTKFTTTLKETEQDALYHFNFEHPKDHIVHNNNNKNRFNERKAYRIHLSGMSKNLFPEGLGNERVISWARQQLAVTKRKESEFRSSSNYGMYDTLDPVVDFSTFYADNETIVDEDLVFWFTLGLHHIPHTEDLPVTPTAGNHLTAWLLPYNYFNECPSMGSRDAIFVQHKNEEDLAEGITLDRNGNSREQCTIPKPTLEEDIEKNPDQILPSRRPLPSF